MAEFDFTLIRASDGFVVSSGSAGSSAQLQVQADTVPPGHMLVVGEWITPGWYWNGKSFVPPAPDPVTVAMVKREAGRRLSYTDWYEIRALRGTPIPASIAAERAAILAAADALEAMDPIPTDYRDPRHWP